MQAEEQRKGSPKSHSLLPPLLMVQLKHLASENQLPPIVGPVGRAQFPVPIHREAAVELVVVAGDGA